MKKKYLKFYLFLLFATISFSKPKVILGIEQLIGDKFFLIKDKNIGIVANHTSILSNGIHLVDYLYQTKQVNIKAVFGPEHGFRGEAPDGKKIENETDPKTGIPVYSLYGKINKPTKDMLKDIEVLIFDIQDVGARFYTYISTLNNCIESAAENNIKFIVCDRPNPIGGIQVDGPVLKPENKSFVGIQPIPIQHGMTIGELANLFNEEGWLNNKLKAEIEIIKVKNWKREMYWEETGLNWIKPSPNIVNSDAEIVYPGICLIEATNVSEGRGTMSPFLQIGAPFINSEDLINEINKHGLKGYDLTPVQFTPQKIVNMTNSPKFEDKLCFGINIKISKRLEFNSVKFGIALIASLIQLYSDKFQIRESGFTRLAGDKKILEMLNNNFELEKIFDYWENELNNFKKIRSKYLLY